MVNRSRRSQAKAHTCRSRTPAAWAVGRSRWGEGSWGQTDPSVPLYTGATRWAAASSRTWCCDWGRWLEPVSSSGWSSWWTPPTSSWPYLQTGDRTDVRHRTELRSDLCWRVLVNQPPARMLIGYFYLSCLLFLFFWKPRPQWNLIGLKSSASFSLSETMMDRKMMGTTLELDG